MKLHFGPFSLDWSTRQLLRGDEDVHLSPKAFELLWALVERRPSVIEKSELVARIWPNTFVGDANLNVLIGELRRALGDTAHRPQFVRTVHGVGYAFCGDVAELRRSPEDRDASRFWLLWNERKFELRSGENLIGRDPACTVWLDEPGVSRRHASVRVEVARRVVTIVDLNSTNGTAIGERPLAGEHSLADGEVIRVGSVALTFRAWFAETSRETERIRRAPST